MQRSVHRVAQCFFRCNGGRPRLINYDGNSYFELLEMLKAKFSPKFKDWAIGDLQIFKANEEIVTREIGAIFTGDCQTEENSLIVALRPKKISIIQGSGVNKAYEVHSDAHLAVILKQEGIESLVDQQGIESNSYEELEDDVTYKPKLFKVNVKCGTNRIYEKLFQNQSEYSLYLLSEGIRGLTRLDGEIISDLFKIIEGDILNKPKRVKIVTYNSYTSHMKEETTFFYSDAGMDSFLSVRELFGIYENPDLNTVVSFDSMRPEKTYFGFPRDSYKKWVGHKVSFLEKEAIIAAKIEIAARLKEQNFDPQLCDKPRKFYSRGVSKFEERLIQEWDAVFYSESTDCLYLFECKHQMRSELLEEIQERVSKFMDIIKDAGIEDGEIITQQFKSNYKEVKGIVCADQFPKELRDQAKSFGLITMVRSDSNPDDWILDEF
jgi:hypothetical protein